MVPAQEFVRTFFGSIDDYSFQAGGTLSASNIGYSTLEGQKAIGNLNKLMNLSIHN
jgi:hypothetical protein